MVATAHASVLCRKPVQETLRCSSLLHRSAQFSAIQNIGTTPLFRFVLRGVHSGNPRLASILPHADCEFLQARKCLKEAGMSVAPVNTLM